MHGRVVVKGYYSTFLRHYVRYFQLSYTAHLVRVWYISCVVLLLLYMLRGCAAGTCVYTALRVRICCVTCIIYSVMCAYMLRSVYRHARYMLRGICTHADYIMRCIITSHVIAVSHLLITIFTTLFLLVIFTGGKGSR